MCRPWMKFALPQPKTSPRCLGGVLKLISSHRAILDQFVSVEASSSASASSGDTTRRYAARTSVSGRDPL